ncbi:arginyl-tRNA-protein transferase [Sulfurimonas hongkongensis]|uniref:Aspartate/glutamate leucyltransferase n=1 Tax=Sulfurimonas hongkongensis TaxID=1172190 RepID=T0JNR5_9BACT|nr:arginyltransferase [Sulfurimonas hongkongensis]EQB39741.1 arginyl-tRNA-protein transferase [Sulfurimonas hongkongensis]
MNLLKEFYLNDSCSYLENKDQTTHYKVIENCDERQCSSLIQRGYRRFGKMYFRPICKDCDECKSIKIDVKNFEFSKSHKRVMKKAKHIKSYIQAPSMTKKHLQLFDKYHLYMRDKKGWEHSYVDPQNYYSSFVNGHNGFGYEVLYYDENRLIGVDLIDVLKDGISSIYFYYDPDYSSYSLGKLSLLYEIEFAKRQKKDWIYLGYYVKDCGSLSYKASYKPYLTLEGRPEEDEDFSWV